MATKQGWPSVIPASIRWKSAVARSASSGPVSLYAVLASVDVISSRYTGSTSALSPRGSRSSAKNRSASGAEPAAWVAGCVAGDGARVDAPVVQGVAPGLEAVFGVPRP